ncbi:MAG: glutamate--tRNA ligase [Spirochaetaceae bacterium]
MSVRVRYAPSPTGLQHIGGVRTALFNYFFARSRGGAFILRVEDTDQKRYDPRALEDIFQTFSWLGLSWDEGPEAGGPHEPYFQSQRTELYRSYAEALLESGNAYHCYTSNMQQEEEASSGEEDKKKGGYDRSSRDLSEEQRKAYEAEGITPVVRLRVPLEGTTEIEDLVLGRIRKKNKDLPPDPILLKSDGYPTYHLANVVDDHLMGITHVLRAQEWVPSTPIHVLIYRALGWEPPTFCHLPMVMGKDGQKLSKRHGSTSVVDFRKQGYLPEAIINYISLLGWAYDDSREFFTREELEELFDVAKLNKAPAVFDYRKLDWFNGQYIRRRSEADLAQLCLPYMQEAGLIGENPSAEERSRFEGMMPLIRERLNLLSEAPGLLRFLYEEISRYDLDDLVPKKLDAAEALRYLTLSRQIIEEMQGSEEQALEERFRREAEAMDAKLGNLLMPLRVALTGSRVSPPLFGSIAFLGWEESLRRIDRAIEFLDQNI